MNSHRIGQVKRAEDNMSGARTIFILKSMYMWSIQFLGRKRYKLKVAPVFRQMLDYILQIEALAIEHLLAITK